MCSYKDECLVKWDGEQSPHKNGLSKSWELVDNLHLEVDESDPTQPYVPMGDTYHSAN